MQFALENLNHEVGCGTIANALKANGIEPAPERGKRSGWLTFLRAHWTVFAGSDFFSVEGEVSTPRGFITHDVLYVTGHADRVVRASTWTENLS